MVRLVASALILAALHLHARPARAGQPPPVVFEWRCDARAIALDAHGSAYVSTANRLLVFNRSLAGSIDRTPNIHDGICDFRDVRGLAVLADGSCVAANFCLQKFDVARNPVWQRTQAASAVAVDGEGRIYMISPDHAVLRFTPGGVLRDSWEAVDLAAGRFRGARGIAVDPAGFIYLADTENDRVRKYDLEMNPVTSWRLEADGEIYRKPWGIGLDPTGNVYVTTLMPAQVFKFSAAGEPLSHWGGSGDGAGALSEPTGVVITQPGDVYVVDQGRRIVMFGTRQPGDPPPPPSPPPPSTMRDLPPRPPKPRPPTTPGTLQAIIDAAADGATIAVPAGTWRENLDFGNRSLVLVSLRGARHTILDGSTHPDEPVVRLGAGLGACTVRGFTITGSRGECAVLVEGGAVTLEDNTIKDNQALGIKVQAGQVVVRRNGLFGNDNSTGGGFGGAIRVAPPGPEGVTAVIVDNHFRMNRSRFGSALHAEGAAITFRDNLVEDNACEHDGGAIFLWNTIRSALIERNRFLRNTAGDHGGAIAAWHLEGGHADIRFNVFALNRALGAGDGGSNGTGGAVHIAGASGTFTNNTVAFNSAAPECGGGGIAVGDYDWLIEKNVIAWNGTRGLIVSAAAGALTVRRNIIFGNNISDLNCLGQSSGSLARFEDNLELDPMFCNSGNGDYRLSNVSPALTGGKLWGAYLDAGCNLIAVIPSTWSSIKARFLGRP